MPSENKFPRFSVEPLPTKQKGPSSSFDIMAIVKKYVCQSRALEFEIEPFVQWWVALLFLVGINISQGLNPETLKAAQEAAQKAASAADKKTK